jgi:hypothetical protein
VGRDRTQATEAWGQFPSGQGRVDSKGAAGSQAAPSPLPTGKGRARRGRRVRSLADSTLAVVLALALGPGCAGLRWSLQKSLRDPGERLETFPEVVWEEYDCDTQRRPFFIMERNELIPPRVEPGGEFNHRMVYVMCPARATEVVPGRLMTRIRFKGSPIVRETDERYEIKPGRWVVDSFVRLPEQAEPGIYAYEIEFDGIQVDFDKHLTFLVRAP